MTNLGAAPRGFGWQDWLVVAAYAAVSLGIGFHYARKQRTTEEYFTAGRNKNPFLAGVSLFAALFTVISYISNPGEYIQNGPVVAITHAMQFPFTYLAAGYLMIPVIMRLPITSAYELLEGRLGHEVRLMGSILFILIRLVWMSLILFTVSRVLVATMGWDARSGAIIEVMTGAVTVAYTLLGGIEAVMVTDVVQLFVLLAGAFLTVATISIHMGGIGAWWPRHWQPYWAPEPAYSSNPHVRVTVASGLISSVLWAISVSGSDQIVVQRYLTTRDARTARRAYLLNALCSSGVALFLAITGAALLGFYQHNPGAMPAHLSFARNGDQFFPHYISHFLPPGISGLVVAGILASAMSGLSSGINSITTVVSKDLIETFRKGREPSERAKVRTARLIAFGIGTVVVLGSLGMGLVRGNLTEVSGKTDRLFVCPIFGIFFLAMFVRFSTAFGAIMGLIYSLSSAVLVGYWDVLTGLPKLSFQWIQPVSLAVSLVCGCLFSLLPTRGKPWPVLLGWTAACLAPLVILFTWVVREGTAIGWY